MINIYAQTFMNATRTDCVRLRDVPSVADKKRLGWFARRAPVCVNLSKL